MGYHDVLMGLGSWEQRFKARPHLLDLLVPGHHVVYRRGVATAFTGVLNEPGRVQDDQIVGSGAGPEWWLGTDDREGPIRNDLVFIDATEAVIVAELLKRQDGTQALAEGTIPTGETLQAFQVHYETCRSALRRLAGMLQREYRVNPDFTLDWDPAFVQRDIVLATEAGTIEDVEYEPSTFRAFSRAIAVGAGVAGQLQVDEATSVVPTAWRDWADAPYQRDVMVDLPSAEDEQQTDLLAQSVAAFSATEDREATVTLRRPDLLGRLAMGDTVFVHKRHVLEGPELRRTDRGETYPCVAMRVVGIEVEPGSDHEVFIRLPDGSERDVTSLADLADHTTVKLKLRSAPAQLLTGTPQSFFESRGPDTRRYKQPLDIVTGDIAEGAIETSKLADGAVIQEKIAARTIRTDRLVVGDFSNLAEDPGFELPEAGAWTPGPGSGPEWAHHEGDARTGSWCLQRVADGTGTGAREHHNRMENPLDVVEGDELYVEARFASADSADGTTQAGITWWDEDGLFLSRDFGSAVGPTASYGVSTLTATAPAGAVSALPAVRTQNHLTGTWRCDDVWFRRTLITAWLADAAIVTAKIANLAVTNAKIANLVADKITSGNILATLDITSGLIRTSSSGDRVELTSGGVSVYKGNLLSHLIDPESFKLLVRPGETEGLNSINWMSPVGQLIGRIATTRHPGQDDRVLQKLFDPSSGQQLCEFRMMRTRGVLGERWNIAELGRFTQHGLIYSNGERLTFTNYGTSASSARTYSWAWPAEAPIPDPFITLSDLTGGNTQPVWATAKARTGCTIQARNHSLIHHGGASGDVTVSFVPMAVE